MMQLIEAIIRLPQAIDNLANRFESMTKAWKEYQDAQWVQEALAAKAKLEKASNMDEVRAVLNDLSSLQRRV